MQRAALGFRVHSGWAALVAIAGSPPAVIDRRRIEIADPAIAGSVQPFHAAEGLAPAEAEQLIQRCSESTQCLARDALRSAVDNLRETGHAVAGCGVLLGSGRPLPPLAQILASHALIHTAEGEFFRDAMVGAARHCGLEVTGIKERELLARASADLHASVEELQRRLAELGRAVGPPWQQDQKQAALVAWLALANAPLR
jgi:hypothetical protein